MNINEPGNIYDVAIVGCGPAGLSAAINARRRNVSIILMGSNFCSPKMYKALEINNYLGFHNISGDKLRSNFLNHVRKTGIEITRAKIENIYERNDFYTLVARNSSFQAYSIVLAVGVSNEDYLDGEEEMVGKGVSYCATCDAPIFKDKIIAIVAYTEEGIEDTQLLADFAEKVFFIPVFNYDKGEIPAEVEIIRDKPVAITGKNEVETLELENTSLVVDGVFIFREITPPDKLIFGLEIKNSHIIVNKNMETNIAGVYAAGDCTGKPYQLARAVGQGQVAGLKAASYVHSKRKEVETVKV